MATPTSSDEEEVVNSLTSFEPDGGDTVINSVLCDWSAPRPSSAVGVWQAGWGEGFPMGIGHRRVRFASEADAAAFVQQLRDGAAVCQEEFAKGLSGDSEIVFGVPPEELPDYAGVDVSAGPGISPPDEATIVIALPAAQYSLVEAFVFWVDGQDVSVLSMVASPALVEALAEDPMDMDEFVAMAPTLLERIASMLTGSLATQPPELSNPVTVTDSPGDG